MADLQVDSLNQNPYGGVSGSDEEDAQEDTDSGGKILGCNVQSYSPNSNKPGWADFSAAPSSHPPFATMHLFLQGFPANTQVRLKYSGSDPAGVSQDADGNWQLPQNGGCLRVWTQNVYQPRSLSNYIAPNTAYSFQDLKANKAQVADGHFVFYVESVKGTTSLAESQVSVEINTQTLGSSWVPLDTVRFAPFDLSVDANRDGIIKFAGNANVAGSPDVTLSNKPFRIWCNDDFDTQDNSPDGEPLSGIADSVDNEIKSMRDLEDFMRLHLYIGGLQGAIASGTIQVGLEWRNTSGSSPSIKIYRAAEPNGGNKYLTNENGEYCAALQQAVPFKTALGTIDSNGGFKFPLDFWQSTGSGIPTFDADHPNRYILFEGVTEGKGQLVITFWKGNQKIGEGGSVWLDLVVQSRREEERI